MEALMNYIIRKKTCLVFILFTLFLFPIVSCGGDDSGDGGSDDEDFRGEMRSFVSEISDYAKGIKGSFAIIPQNGVELFTLDGEHEGEIAKDYLAKIDATGQEDLFYGYDEDDKATENEEMEWIKGFLDIGKAEGITIMVTDYCSTPSNMNDSYAKSQSAGFISFAADSRDLDQIPSYPAAPFAENSNDITAIAQAKNFLYLINPSQFATKEAMITAIKATNYDAVLIDAFFNEAILGTSDVEQLKVKANGASRIVICYMSIGEAENYRYYWKDEWDTNPPSWMAEENPDWEGNFKVRYWDSEWKNIIYGNQTAYLDLILACGFDGVYLDIIDAFEYFEDN